MVKRLLRIKKIYFKVHSENQVSNEKRWLLYYRNTSNFRLKNCQKYIIFENQ